MRQYAFKLVNVFAESHFGGNPLAVFPNADGLNDHEMQQIAKQFNLSETVFAFSSQTAVADLRIFTPEYELPLAGHPTLGCAYVLQKTRHLPADFVLNTQAKAVSVRTHHSQIEMAIQGYEIKPSLASHYQLADCLGLPTSVIAPVAYWLNSGSPQLLLELFEPQALEQVQVNHAKLQQICQQDGGRCVIYLWHKQDNKITTRFFYAENGIILEDSGTGSACANLGAYFLSQGQYPLTCQLYQGDQMGRPNRLSLKLDEHQTIYVGGNVIDVGEGTFNLPCNG